MNHDELRAWYESHKGSLETSLAVAVRQTLDPDLVAELKKLFESDGNDLQAFELAVVHQLDTTLRAIVSQLPASLAASTEQAKRHQDFIERKLVQRTELVPEAFGDASAPDAGGMKLPDVPLVDPEVEKLLGELAELQKAFDAAVKAGNALGDHCKELEGIMSEQQAELGRAAQRYAELEKRVIEHETAKTEPPPDTTQVSGDAPDAPPAVTIDETPAPPVVPDLEVPPKNEG